RVVERRHDQLSVFGIVDSEEAALIRPLARALQARGALLATDHGGLMLGGDARGILKGEDAVLIALPPRREKTRRQRGGAGSAANPVGDPLFDALRALRRELAQQAGVPPYVVFHDSVLREMAAGRPQSLAELGRIGGVGDRKLTAYGDAFLTVIRQH
ncbi:MAG TPA: HRDC domain-containing protein, partial [Novosphingobium sp.]